MLDTHIQLFFLFWVVQNHHCTYTNHHIMHLIISQQQVEAMNRRDPRLHKGREGCMGASSALVALHHASTSRRRRRPVLESTNTGYSAATTLPAAAGFLLKPLLRPALLGISKRVACPRGEKRSHGHPRRCLTLLLQPVSYTHLTLPTSDLV